MFKDFPPGWLNTAFFACKKSQKQIYKGNDQDKRKGFLVREVQLKATVYNLGQGPVTDGAYQDKHKKADQPVQSVYHPLNKCVDVRPGKNKRHCGYTETYLGHMLADQACNVNNRMGHGIHLFIECSLLSHGTREG
jgi:hypothetical protein